jgi:GntR family transcriptional repressor for pyruvate dehydrogenase complex
MEQDFLLTPLDVSPAYEAVVERLSKAVALGFILPGERLPSERTLAERLGVSRVTVREALRVLQGAGVLATRGGSSGWTVVSAHGADGRPLVSADDSGASIEAVFEFRVAVESMAARLAATRRTDEEIALLTQHHEALGRSVNVGGFRRADSAFHLTVADIAANPLIRRSVFEARAAAFATLDQRPYEVRRASSSADHARILAAITAGAPDDAERAMIDHLERAREEVLTALGSCEPEPPPAGVQRPAVGST